MSMFSRSDKTPDTTAADADAARSSRERDQRSEASRKSAPPSIISAGLTVKGDLESAGEIQVDGHVEGDVRGKTVRVGEGAFVKGSVFGDSATVAGTIEGRIEAMTVTLQKTAKMTGDIIHQTVQIDSGAYIDGHCSPHFGKTEIRAITNKAVAPAPAPAQAGADKQG